MDGTRRDPVRSGAIERAPDLGRLDHVVPARDLLAVTDQEDRKRLRVQPRELAEHRRLRLLAYLPAMTLSTYAHVIAGRPASETVWVTFETEPFTGGERVHGLFAAAGGDVCCAGADGRLGGRRRADGHLDAGCRR